MRYGPAFKVHVGDQLLAALADTGRPMSTPELQGWTGYGSTYGQLAWQVLNALASAGQVERVTAPGSRPVYWRRTMPVPALPPGLL